MIEGEIIEGQRVVVIEDLISTGKSSLQAVEALRNAGCDVVGLVAIFSYGFDVADENFKAAKCRYTTLSNYSALLKFAVENGFISHEDEDLLREWRRDPANWEPKTV